MGIPIHVIVLVDPSTKLKHVVITDYIYDERGEGGWQVEVAMRHSLKLVMGA